MKNLEFTFKTVSDYFSAKMTGFIPEFNYVRVEVVQENGLHMDFPLYSQQEYFNYLEIARMNNTTVLNVYPVATPYELKHSCM